jgi:hypothetical protein
MNTNYCAELIDSMIKNHHVNSLMYSEEIKKSIKFRIPDNGIICEIKTKKTWLSTFQPYIPILKLPYNLISLELKLKFESPNNREECETIPAVILCKQLDEGIAFYPFLGPTPNENDNWFCFTEKPCLLKGQWHEYPSLQVGPKDQTESEFIGIILNVILNFLSALNCSNAEALDDDLPHEKLNKSRIKKGKTPLFSYKVLTINTQTSHVSSPTTAQGKHNSPRVHLRRGHIRKLPDKNVWVNSCVVGDKKSGIIHKEYLVK